MTPDDLRRKRLEELLDLACIARGWTRARLAKALGRDASNIANDTGNPKLDYLVRLAAVLEWPLGEVGAAIWGPDATPLTPAALPASPKQPAPSESYEAARAAAYESMKRGDYNTAIEHTRVMYRTARTEDERAKALANESSCWYMLGRHQMSIEVAQQGLAMESLTVARRLQFQTSLVLSLFKLRNLTLALSLAESVAKQASAHLGVDPSVRRWLALCLCTEGFCHLYLMLTEPDRVQEHTRESARAFAAAKDEFRAAAEILNEPELLGVAHSCDAGLIELEVESGRLSADTAVQRIYNKLEEAIEFEGMTSYWIESYGWWSLAGASIASRHLKGDELQRVMAVCMNKATEIASRLDQLHFVATLYSTEFTAHQSGGRREPLLLDEEDVKNVARATLYVPWFRQIGLQMLRDCERVGCKKFAPTGRDVAHVGDRFGPLDWRELLDDSRTHL